MAGTTPIYGIPYPESSDLVANYPALGESLAETLDDKLPTYSATAPTSPSVGQVWIDSSGSPIGKVWDGSAWTIFSGAGAANFSDTATGTYTDTGIDYKYITYTGSGTLTVTAAGLADVLVVGGGGGTASGYGAGGGGGFKRVDNIYLPAGSLTITVGAGGGTPAAGTASSIGTILASGGGGRGLASGENHAYTSGAGSAGGVGGYTSSGNSANGAGGYGAISDSITGSAVNYATSGDTAAKTSAPGAGGTPRNTAVTGNPGTVIVRVRTN